MRSVLHIDMNACYASIECLYDPSIRNLPVAVGGDVEARHGIILAKNQIAKRFGVKTGEALWQAKQKCPELHIVPPHFDRYLRFSRMAREIYADYTDLVEPFGLDEVWCDVTGTQKLRERGMEALANEIRERVKFELGITVSVGASWNKIFAKLGSDYKKPDAVTVFTPENYRDKVWSLPASDLLGVGRATERKLASRGIHTIGDIAAAPPSMLRGFLGKWGLILHDFATGYDSSPVARAGDEAVIKSIGNSTTTPRDLCCDEDAGIVYWMLCESVAERMRESGFLCRGVQVHIRDNELASFERQLKLESPTCLASTLHEAAMRLLRENWDWHKPLRSIGVRATDLLPASTPVQCSIFEDSERQEKRERLERSVDDLRRRFGHYCVGRAVCVSDPTLRNINPKDEHVIHPVGYFKAV